MNPILKIIIILIIETQFISFLQIMFHPAETYPHTRYIEIIVEGTNVTSSIKHITPVIESTITINETLKTTQDTSIIPYKSIIGISVYIIVMFAIVLSTDRTNELKKTNIHRQRR